MHPSPQQVGAKETLRRQDNERKTIAAFKNEFPNEKIEQDHGVPVASSRNRETDGYKIFFHISLLSLVDKKSRPKGRLWNLSEIIVFIF